MTAVFDTNVLIDFLNGIPEARVELRRHRERAVSIITFIEVLAGVSDEDEERRARRLLSRFTVVELSDSVAERAMTNRRLRRLKVPDAVILATAQELGWHLLTRNIRDFPVNDPMIRVPYTV